MVAAQIPSPSLQVPVNDTRSGGCPVAVGGFAVPEGRSPSFSTSFTLSTRPQPKFVEPASDSSTRTHCVPAANSGLMLSEVYAYHVPTGSVVVPLRALVSESAPGWKTCVPINVWL